MGLPSVCVTCRTTTVLPAGAIVACPSLSTGPSGSPVLGGVTVTLADPTTFHCRCTGSPTHMCRGTAENALTWALHAESTHTTAANPAIIVHVPKYGVRRGGRTPIPWVDESRQLLDSIEPTTLKNRVIAAPPGDVVIAGTIGDKSGSWLLHGCTTNGVRILR